MDEYRLPLVLRAIRGLAMVCALIAGLCVAMLAVLILIDIVGRSFFHQSLQGTDELGGYVLALCGSLGLSWALVNRGHPRIELGFRLFPPLLRSALHVLAQGTICLFAIFMTWHAIGELETTLKFGAVTNTPLQTPLWLPQSLWVFGLALFSVSALSATLNGAWLLKHDSELVSRLYGPLSVEDEVGEYVASEDTPSQENTSC